MGGRELTRLERLRYRVPDWPEMARNGLFAFLRTVALFFRWAWLRIRGKTAYRFAPAYETKREVDGTVHQANGLTLPYAWKNDPDEIDWDTAIREQFEKLDKK